METFKSYVYKDRKHDFSRAYRETLIFQMINNFDRKLNDDNARNFAETQNLTLAQKRRIRNEVVRLSSDRVKDNPDASINDTDVIVDSFFDSNFGKQFEADRADWEANEKDRMVAAVSSWTTGQSADGNLRFTVSPYDPHFAGSDLFDDEHDQIGYVVGATKQGGKPGVANSAVGKSDKRNSYFFAAAPNKDLYLTGVVLGKNGTVEPTDDAAVAEMGKNPDIRRMYGTLSESGYNDIKHFIKTKANARAIRDYLLEETADNLLGDDERKFMTDVCSWLSSSGIDFNVELEDAGGSKSLVASFGRRKNIRLLDRDNPTYQGRIYDDGVVGYMSIDAKVRPDEPGYREIYSNITAEDRLNAVKWYFGEDVSIRNDTQLSGYNELPIGAKETVRAKKAGFYAIDGDRLNTVSKMGGNDPSTLVTVSLTEYDTTKTRAGKSYTRTDILPIMFRLKQNGAYDDIIPSMKEWAFNNTNIDHKTGEPTNNGLTGIMKRVTDDTSKFYPDDIDPETGVFKDTVTIAHRDYYRHVFARETLNNWVESAKENHSELVNIDDIVDCYNNCYADGNGYEYHFSADEDIAEIQRLYWDVLVGVRETGKTKVKDDETSIDAFSNDIYKSSLDEKVAAIKDHYDGYKEKAFGRVPEIRKPFASEEENLEIAKGNVGAGFDPTMLAKYMKTDRNYSLQRNYDYIRHLLSSLEDDYDPSFIKDGSYMANEIKKDMVKFDQSTAVYQNYSNSLERNTGILLSNVVDENTGEVDYDKLYEVAPALREKPFTSKMLMHTADTLRKSGCEMESIEVNVDDNGIISYRGVQSFGKVPGNERYNPSVDYSATAPKGAGSTFTSFSGTIGQIFEPDENGVIIPNYGGAGETNKVIIPGYDVYLTSNDPDNPTRARDRLRFSGLEQQMRQAISAEIHKAAFSSDKYYNFVPHTTAVNRVYRHAYSTELTAEEYHDRLDPAKSSYAEVETFKASIDTLKNRCRFPNEYGEGSTTEAQSMLEHPFRQEAKDYDYYYSDLNDNRNMRVLDEEYDGVFCWRMTGGAKTQGLVRYLVDGVEIGPDGKATAPDYDPNDPPVCALMKDAMMKGTEHDTWDRNLMSSTQALTALRTPRHVGVAMLNLKGDTFDDGFTVSKAFADKYKIKGADGELRSLMPQDKLSDKHGNKGVITRVVDPTQHSSYMMNEVDCYDITNNKNAKVRYRDNEYSFEYDGKILPTNEETVRHMNKQAVKAIQSQLGIDDDICKFFENNPKLDIVASPYSGMSRSNGGTIRDLMNEPDDLNIKGQNVEGGMGYMDMIVVDMPADVKTHWYDDDAIREGKGRKASGQLLWVLGANGADKIIDEFYGDNSRAWDNLREYSIAMGMDLTPDLKPTVGYHEQSSRGEHRRLIEMIPDEELDAVNFNKNAFDMNKTSYNGLHVGDRYLSELNKSGGFMELPFQLDFKTASYTHTKGKAKAAGDSLFKLSETGHTYQTADGETHPTYGMPVLPPSMRSGQDFKDGTARTHDYTNWYLDIADKATAYRVFEKRRAELSVLTEDDIKNFSKEDAAKYKIKNLAERDAALEGIESKMEDVKKRAQSTMDKIVGDIADKQFNTKYNNLREQGMAKKLPSSATAVISAGINLKSDEVAMSREHAVQLGIMNYDDNKDEYYWADRSLNPDGSVKNPGGGQVILWRDPILRSGAVRYMNVVIDDSVLGIKINPVMGKSFDGDFDGDSYATAALKSKAAKAQAFSKFHVSNNLLDLGYKDPKTGKYPLYINSGMDVTAIMHKDKTGALKAKFDSLTDKANEMQAAIEKINAGEMSMDDFKFEARVIKKENGERVKDERGNYVYETNADGSYKTVEFTGKKAINACKMECKNDLDDFVLTAFNDIGTDHIVVKNPETVVASCQNIVDSGAKGNQGKMRSLMDNIGIDYDLGEDGRALPETAVNITHDVNGEQVPCPRSIKDGELSGRNLFREENKRIQETTAYKADNTQLGGTSSQNGVSAFRNTDHLFKLLEITYPITQGILQSKHDPQDAKDKDGIVRFWGRDTWDGYKLTGNWDEKDPAKIISEPHNRIVKTAMDENGRPIPVMERVEDTEGNVSYVPKCDDQGRTVYETYYEKCTPDEWVKQMKGMMCALKVNVNEEFFAPIAKQMTVDRKVAYRTSDRTSPVMYFDQDEKKQKTVYHNKPVVMGTSEYAEQRGALLDRVAYTGRLTAYVKSAMDNYFEKTDESLAGNAVSKGVEIMNLKTEMRSGGSKDTKALKAQIEQLTSEIDNSGAFISKNIIQEAYGDAYRAETGNDKNLVIKRGEEKFVAPIPLGRKDCQVSADDYRAGVRCMGESDIDYTCRMNSIYKEYPDESVETKAEPAVNPFAELKQQAEVIEHRNAARSQEERNRMAADVLNTDAIEEAAKSEQSSNQYAFS